MAHRPHRQTRSHSVCLVCPLSRTAHAGPFARSDKSGLASVKRDGGPPLLCALMPWVDVPPPARAVRYTCRSSNVSRSGVERSIPAASLGLGGNEATNAGGRQCTTRDHGRAGSLCLIKDGETGDCRKRIAVRGSGGLERPHTAVLGRSTTAVPAAAPCRRRRVRYLHCSRCYFRAFGLACCLAIGERPKPLQAWSVVLIVYRPTSDDD